MTPPSLDTELQQPLPGQTKKYNTQARSWPRSSPLTPAQMFAVMALAIFVCECGVMFLLHKLPPITPFMEAIVDSSALLLSLLPFYFFFYRPFWSEHQQFSTEVSVLSRKLMDSVEAERKRLSHDLHDQCGQTVTALQFRTGALQKSLSKESIAQQKQLLEMNKLILQLSTELRDVTYQLRPETLETLGLVSAMQDLTTDFRSIHPEVLLEEFYDYSAHVNSDLRETLELALYRICQECLNNIAKHADATHINLHLANQAGQIILCVSDNGKGFVIRRCHGGTRQGRQGIGLLGIRERANDLGGSFDLTTQPGSGTTVKVVIPIASEGTNGTSN